MGLLGAARALRAHFGSSGLPGGAKMEPKCGPKGFGERSEIGARLRRRLEAVLELEEGRWRSQAAKWRRPLGGK